MRWRYQALLMSILTAPGSGWALGLGEVHVHSALNEPLAAQIEIISATTAELATLSARIAEADKFQMYGAERAPFLSGFSFSVGSDSQGRAVLNISSSERVIEPVVYFLVDVRWNQGELIRDYSLLMDPVLDSQSAAPVVLPEAAALIAVAPVVGASRTENASGASAPGVSIADAAGGRAPAEQGASIPNLQSSGLEPSYRVVARDSLWGIVRRLGVRTAGEAQRTMLAIYRGNPQAFDGDMSRLRRGAVLTLPVAGSAAPQPASGTGKPEDTDGAGAQVLRQRIESLQADIAAVHQQLAQTGAALQALRRQAASPAAVPAAPSLAPKPRALAARSGRGDGRRSGQMLAGVLLAGSALAVTSLLVVRLRRRGAARPASQANTHDTAIIGPVALPEELAGKADLVPHGAWQVNAEERYEGQIGVEESVLDESTIRAVAGVEGSLEQEAMEATQEILPPAATLQSAPSAGASAETATVVLEHAAGEHATLDPAAATAELKIRQSTVLDYNLVDLDSSAIHVHMPSELHDRPTVAERRTSIVHALQTALARDPSRSDLRLKLFESYYEMALANQRAFVDLARRQTSEAGTLTASDWQRISQMGRVIAPDDTLFADELSGALADCA